MFLHSCDVRINIKFLKFAFMEIICKRFNELSLDELYLILRARAEVFVVEQNIVYQDMDGIDFSSTHLYIKEGNRICSYLRIIDANVKYPEVSIGRVLTLKPYRGWGYARKLMETAIDKAKQYSLPVKIEAQAYLKDFYLSLGFKQVSDEFILEDIPHIEMILNN